MSLDMLLRQTAKIGGNELRLIPGRKLIVVSADGAEREVQSPEQNNQTIQQLIVPTLTPEAKQSITSQGRASWSLQLSELGTININAQVVNGALQVICRMADGAMAGWTPGQASAPAQ